MERPRTISIVLLRPSTSNWFHFTAIGYDSMAQIAPRLIPGLRVLGVGKIHSTKKPTRRRVTKADGNGC